MKKIYLDKKPISIEDIVSVSRNYAPVDISSEGEARIMRARKLIDKWVKEKKVIYGVTTGFGGMCNVTISPEETRKLQENILMSHAAGVGNPLPEEIVRAIMAIRAHDLSMGHSSCRIETVRYLISFLNEGVTPVIPEKGSVGASGDLAPTAHLGLVMIGKGEAFYKGERMPGSKALEKIDLKPLALEAGEGIALINGTQVMAAIGSLLVHDAHRLSKIADITCAMSLEVLMGSDTEFDSKIHQVRPHPGQIASAENMHRMTENSELITSHKDCGRVQDAYTLRCAPQIHGASKDAISHFKKTIDMEINSTTTNPLIFPEDETFCLGGNFHGQPIALTADYLAIGIAEYGSVSERRVERLVNPQLSELPAFLVRNSGLNSGFMIAQYTAAALVSENKVLAHPASVDSIPTSANKEDHVSMGTIAVRKCREILNNVEHVLAIELLCAAQAMDLISEEKPYKMGDGTQEAYRIIRDNISHLDRDRFMAPDINDMVSLVRSGKIIEAVESKMGKLK
ncbi:MAG: histidine ammonia-lyase [Desulfobacterales bacterium]|nr:histidine ammonia-lyase [Desulfobacterales bacterium]